MKPLSLGFSPCPNDTFIFYALTHDKIDAEGVQFDQPYLEDVETLNDWAMQGRLDVTKLSFHALGHVLDKYCILSAGSALGRGCGPLLICRPGMKLDKMKKVAIPGRYTTAALLFRMFLPGCSNLVEMRFDTILEAVEKGEVDGGVIIHESRFTYADQGLQSLVDLGQWWEDISGLPIPLGCIAARRSLGKERLAKIDKAIQKSLQFSFNEPKKCLPYIRMHSQELEDSVIQDHIGLYVNDFSLQLGEEGVAAVLAFLEKGRREGILPENQNPLVYL